MKYILDNDLHIHTQLSTCSSDPEQNKYTILEYAKEHGFKVICLTDHMWDNKDVPAPNNWYKKQNFEWVKQSLPVIEDDDVTMLFGCEAEIDKDLNLGITRDIIDQMDFVTVATSHLHHKGATIKLDPTLEERRKLWLDKFEMLMNQDLPFHKMGVAHFTNSLMAPDNFQDHLDIISGVDDNTYRRLFTKAAKLGLGIELNIAIEIYDDLQKQLILRPYKIAKECGCKFYFGGDTHHPRDREKIDKRFTEIRDLLDLQESDKFQLVIDKRK